MKISLNRLFGGFLSTSKVNENSDSIEEAFENTLSRDGTSPNQMGANLDMGTHRVINLGAPINPNDAVRLVDVEGIVAGDFTINAGWADIQDKPTTFPPEAHTHPTTEITGFNEAVEDIIGSKVVAGTNITVSYNDGTGETTITGSGATSVAWADVTGKPSVFTPDAHTQTFSTITDGTESVQDIVGAMILEGTGIDVAYNDGAGTITLTATGAAGSITMPNLVTMYGGVGDGSTNNDTAFTNAEASTYDRIWLPEGDFWTTKTNSFFTKWYEGPGKIKIVSGAGTLPGKKQTALTPIDFGTIGATEYGEAGDTSFAEIRYEYIRPGSRESISRAIDLTANGPYFQAGACGTFVRFFSQSGSSGTNAHLVAAANATATTADINSSEGLVIGDVIGFQLSDNAVPGDVVTISNIAVGGGTGGSDRITFSPALNNTYPFAGSDWAVPQYISGYATSSQVSKGRRTNNAHYFFTLDATAGGDHYGILGRIGNSYTLKAGQTDFFDGSTVAFIGGDMSFSASGQYGTPWEFAVSDFGHDVAVINVSTYARTNDTGDRRVTWIHDLPKSEGSKPIDVFYAPNGLGRVGIDFTNANFSSDGERAIQMKTGQRIYFDASASAAVGTRARGFWGNVQGDTYMVHSTDSTEVLDVYVGGTRTLRMRPAAVTTPNAFTSGSTIAATSHITSTSGYVYGAQGCRVPTGSAFYLDGVGNQTYLTFNGSNIFLFKNGVQVATW